MKLIKTIALLIVLLIMVNCSSGDGRKEAKKLLDRQAQLEQKDQENLDETKGLIENTLDEMAVIEDSIKVTQSKILEQDKKLQDEAARLEAEKLQLNLKLQKERLDELASKQDSLSKLLNQTNTSLEDTEKEAVNISLSKDSLEAKGEIISQLDKEISDKLVTGIEEIDIRLENLKDKKSTTLDKIALQKKKITVAEKKLEVLNEEKILYENQKQKLWDRGAPQSEMDAVSNMIETVVTSIENETQKIKSAENNVSDLQEIADGIDKQRNKLSEKIRKNYTSQEILDDFMAEEQERLKKELAILDSTHQKTKAESKAIELEKEGLEESLSLAKVKVFKAESEQINALEQKKTALDKELSDLEQEEENLEEASGESIVFVDSAGNSEVEQLKMEYKAKQQALADERTELARKKQELATEKETIKEEQAQRKKNTTKAILLIIGFIVIILVGLYFIGKSKKSTKKTKS